MMPRPSPIAGKLSSFYSKESWPPSQEDSSCSLVRFRDTKSSWFVSSWAGCVPRLSLISKVASDFMTSPWITERSFKFTLFCSSFSGEFSLSSEMIPFSRFNAATSFSTYSSLEYSERLEFYSMGSLDISMLTSCLFSSSRFWTSTPGNLESSSLRISSSSAISMASFMS